MLSKRWDSANTASFCSYRPMLYVFRIDAYFLLHLRVRIEKEYLSSWKMCTDIFWRGATQNSSDARYEFVPRN